MSKMNMSNKIDSIIIHDEFDIDDLSGSINPDSWECSQCGKEQSKYIGCHENGECDECHTKSEASAIECPLCKIVYNNDNVIYSINGVRACRTCHEEMKEECREVKTEHKNANKGIKKVRKNM